MVHRRTELAKMFDRLEADSDSGFLGYQLAFMGREPARQSSTGAPWKI